MKHLKTNNLTKPPLQGKFAIPQLTNKDIIMKLSSLDIIYATEHEEFYYEGSDGAVPEGEPIGVDIETEEGVDLVLFSNVYWNPHNELPC
jgi:hypothetical protein|tara:strand:- start:64 stop:333 length:270 start_codon:yes stop_codon:yes gene_type:complete